MTCLHQKLPRSLKIRKSKCPVQTTSGGDASENAGLRPGIPTDNRTRPVDASTRHLDRAGSQFDGSARPFDLQTRLVNVSRRPLDESAKHLDGQSRPFDGSGRQVDHQTNLVDVLGGPIDATSRFVDRSSSPIDLVNRQCLLVKGASVHVNAEGQPVNQLPPRIKRSGSVLISLAAAPLAAARLLRSSRAAQAGCSSQIRTPPDRSPLSQSV